MYVFKAIQKKCLGSQANFVKKWMREGGFFGFFSKNFIKSTTVAIVTLSRMICFISFQSKNLCSILFQVQVEDLKVFSFFMEFYNSVNVHDVEKSKIMLHGIKTLLE